MSTDTHPKMSNVNMSDDPRKERELNTITNEDEETGIPESEVENVLGSVHISKPSIKHVFFLLRPILKPVLEAFNRQEHELHELVNAMRLERTFLDKPVAISANIPYEVNYQDRKFLFAWSPIAISLTADDGSSVIPVQAGTWVNISLRRGSKLTAPAVPDTQPQTILVRASDTLLSLDATRAILYGTQNTTGDFPIGVDANGRLKIGTAPANAGTVIGQVVQQAGATTYANTWSVQQSQNNAAVPAGAGTTVIKNAPGTLTTILITAAGTVPLQIFDNASTGAGTIIGTSHAATAIGDVINIFGKALVGMTALGGAGTPGFTVFFS